MIFLLISSLVLAQGNIEDEFKERNGEDWVIGSYPWGYINLATIARPEDLGPQINDLEVLGIANGFMSLNKDLFGLESFEIYNSEIKGYDEHESWVVYILGDVFEGLPVTEIDMRLLMTLDGQTFGAGDVEVCTVVFKDILQGYYPIPPEISEGEAINSAQSSGEAGEGIAEANLKFIPSSETEDFEYMLAWELSFVDKKVIVDAINGSVISTEIIEPSTQSREIIKNPIFLIICIIVIISIGIFLFKRRKVSVIEESNNVNKN
jgi:hypothetical protein